MKLAILGSRGIPARYGGFETFAQELAVRLSDAGVNVTVFCEGSRDSTETWGNSIELRHVYTPRLGPATTVLYDLRCLWSARREFDVVYMLGYGAAIFCFIPRLWRRQVWINMDGVEWSRSKWSYFARLWLKAMEAAAMFTAKRLIADAEAIRTHLERRHKSMPDCSVIAYGAPIVETSASQSSLQQFALRVGKYYLVVCRIEPENHVLEILEGFVQSRSDCCLAIVGDTSAVSRYVARIRGCLPAKDPRVRFLGPVYDQVALRSLRLGCFAYIHGHSVGGTNPSLLEALGCGNRVIAHDNDFNREVAGSHARYFHCQEDLKRQIDEADVESIEQRHRLASAGRERIRSSYSWHRIIRQYQELLDGISGRP